MKRPAITITAGQPRLWARRYRGLSGVFLPRTVSISRTVFDAFCCSKMKNTIARAESRIVEEFMETPTYAERIDEAR